MFFLGYLKDNVKNVAKLFAADLKLIVDASDKVSVLHELASLGNLCGF